MGSNKLTPDLCYIKLIYKFLTKYQLINLTQGKFNNYVESKFRILILCVQLQFIISQIFQILSQRHASYARRSFTVVYVVEKSEVIYPKRNTLRISLED